MIVTYCRLSLTDNSGTTVVVAKMAGTGTHAAANGIAMPSLSKFKNIIAQTQLEMRFRVSRKPLNKKRGIESPTGRLIVFLPQRLLRPGADAGSAVVRRRIMETMRHHLLI